MSILGAIMAKIFHQAQSSAGSAGAGSGGGAPAGSASTAPTSKGPTLGSPTSANTSQDAAVHMEEANASETPGGSAGRNVDVGAVLDRLAAGHAEKLDWKHSIVDLMKLLGLDSSLNARQELAGELAYSGDTHDTATMNVWLHKQVMQKLAANGGQLPADLKV